MRYLLLMAACTLLSVATSAQMEASWLRYPAISPDGSTIVFTYKGDLYTVPVGGGRAYPLTQHEAQDFMPVWSRDGKTIAFASDRYGNFDVFSIPATGGTPTRLTWHSGQEYPYSFSPDDKYIYFGGSRQEDLASNRQFPAAYQPELYRVAAKGGRVELFLTTPAEDISWSRDGKKMLYHDKKGQENQWRKHHTSSVARDLWLYEPASDKHTKLTTFAGEDRTPHFTAGEKEIVYLSEENGSFNVFSMGPGSGSGKALTSFKDHPVRFLTVADNGTLSYGYNGHLYIQRPGEEPRKLSVLITADDKSNPEKLMPVNGGAGDLSVSPNGKEVAFIVRGEVFVSSVDGGTTKRITNTTEPERSVSFSPDGKKLVYASERNGSWKIYETKIVREEEAYFSHATLLKEEAIIANNKENYQPEYSPDGKEIAFIEERNHLKVYNIASKQVRTLLNSDQLFSMRDNDQYFTWSPDSKWILFEYSEKTVWSGEIGLIAADGKGGINNLSRSGYNDGYAHWAMGGKMVFWTSNRDGLRSFANSGGSQSDVYGLFLDADAWERFRFTKEEAALAKEQDEKAAKDSTKKKEKKDTLLKFDLDGIPYRKARLTLHSSSLADAALSKDGETLYYLARFEKGYNLWSTNLRTKETKMIAPLNAGSGSLTWDKEQKTLFILAEGRISKLDPATGKQEPVSISGEMTVDLAQERKVMFDHVWRRTKTTFYTAGYHGADWEKLGKAYEAYLPHIGNAFEFSEMLSELLGELNVSHSGSSYYSANPLGDATASLGVFYDPAYKGEGVKVQEVIKEGPLDKPMLNITPGTIILNIDGAPISADTDFARYLNRKAGKYILLTVTDGKTRRELRVKPISLGEENSLLYKRWVRRNQDEVDRLSNGQLGYVHVPGMNDGAYRTTYDDAMGKYATRKGLVVDTRNNGGGDLVADLAMFLSGKRFLEYTTDNRVVTYEPTFRWTKPSIALANESNYSDGHCFAFSYRDLQLGKLVGMPVPGTCTFAGWETLQDNSVRWGAPPLGVKSMSGKYLENLQTEPDIKLMNEYQQVGKGKDQQLERAVAELMKELH
ncbi:S41 family peptidase [Parasegetibacter sp. NRK P23]|uniref:S41 family peptidase n=1 Tax=Parasegetibacter sp. NRK P23 TaxID=2942999 RepID=UPI00204387D9|nr:S41 family peptidase [Parasegetibacter sp. NRK P23]MCM5529984.1 S41 family peptidase [Parasegetibacter sp. NRK P23]